MICIVTSHHYEPVMHCNACYDLYSRIGDYLLFDNVNTNLTLINFNYGFFLTSQRCLSHETYFWMDFGFISILARNQL